MTLKDYLRGTARLLLEHVDPTDAGGQFVDRGAQYRSVIFYHDEDQKRLAEKSKEALSQSGKFNKPIATEILKFTKFYQAEDYHQDYYKTHSLKYKFYRYGSGRDQFLEKTWGKQVETVNPNKKNFIRNLMIQLEKEIDFPSIRSHPKERNGETLQK